MGKLTDALIMMAVSGDVIV